ncbi:helix-turn-helix domain-containing protein [Brassicibacter mesophilus]|uniref:helix-turn-helix domain-containing protein n=1 Tax=Brassicibacter mesophilus TaxID=745119 RepID=UPI003D1CB476
MSKSIGEKIKELRKELKITQSELAGKDMTKSMLSQIENNIATPSMKNLKLIAKRLDKPVSYFLEDDCLPKNELPINEIREKVKEINSLIDSLKYEKSREELYALLSKYNFKQNDKLYSDILYKLGECLAYLNLFDESEKVIDKAVNIYEKNQLYSDAAIAYIEKINRYMSDFNYMPCLDILDKATDVYNLSITKDYLFEIKLMFIKALVYSGLGDFNNTVLMLKKAISFSNEKKIYYKSDSLYQTLASINLISRNYDEFKYNIHKAEQFALFTEDKLSMSIIHINYAEFEIHINNPQKAIEYLNSIEDNMLRKDLKIFYTMAKAKALYLLEDYENALTLLEKMNYNYDKLLKHDYLFMWSAKIYHGLTLFKLGKYNEALKEMHIGIAKLEVFQNSIYHVFAYKSISEIYHKLKEFETAFKYLKMANDMEDDLKGLPFK